MRHEDTPELFGGGCGAGTSGDIECGVCHAKYNQGADEAGDYGNGESVTWTDFAGVTVCDCCFEKIENEVLKRMPKIIPWYKRILDKRLSRAVQQQMELSGLDGYPNKGM